MINSLKRIIKREEKNTLDPKRKGRKEREKKRGKK